jgi:hypothetical protein
MPQQTASLLECLAEALESTAFVSLMPVEGEVSAPSSTLVATIPLGAAGRIHLAAPAALGALIATNILSLEPGAPEAMLRARDAMKEILNMTAGAYSSTLDPIPEMGLPEISTLDDAPSWESWVGRMSAEVVLADEHVVAIAFEGRS